METTTNTEKEEIGITITPIPSISSPFKENHYTGFYPVSIEELDAIKQEIEELTKYHQIEILNILHNHRCKLNENKSGVFINLSFLSKEILDDVKKYIHYAREQEENLIMAEYQKAEYQNTFV